MKSRPLISVIMPFFNVEQYINEAIESILKQTFDDFEFIIINDGSNDNSRDIVKKITDKRIILLENKNNIGNYPSRNKGLSLARGKYICVMDADDIAYSQRIERQYIFMESNKEIGISGSGFSTPFNQKDIYRVSDHDLLKVLLFHNNCLSHPTLIMRRKFLDKYNLKYNEYYKYSSDFDLMVRASEHLQISNIPEILLYYRQHNNCISIKHRSLQKHYANEIKIKQLGNLGIVPNSIESHLHIKLFNREPIHAKLIEQTKNWIDKILIQNKTKKYYNQEHLEVLLEILLENQPLLSD